MAEADVTPVSAKLESFLQWLHVNGAELRGCTIKFSDAGKGFGVFAAVDIPADGIVMVVPLDLAITPTRVLQDPLLGPFCRAMFEEGHVDDRFLVMLYLMLERLRPESPWKPYLDMLPSTFGNPLWFTEKELEELKGTALYQATVLQKKSLKKVYDDKVKVLFEEIGFSDPQLKRVRLLQFDDFLWANSVFWARALNIPVPQSYIFSEQQCQRSVSEKDQPCSLHSKGETSGCTLVPGVYADLGNSEDASSLMSSETIWIEGLVPGIDFCNHEVKAAATWEVDQSGSSTGIPNSMYLVLADHGVVESEKEILISYGDKGNEELLYLYGFVVSNNPDDYIMVHYPMEAFQNVAFFDAKAKLLELQKAELRCLLSKKMLGHGLSAADCTNNEDNKEIVVGSSCSYSWCGQRKVPRYVNKLIFPQEFLTALRTIAMQEDELNQVSSLLEELEKSGVHRQPSDDEVRAAIWEACGDLGALRLLVDLLSAKLMSFEEDSEFEACNDQLLDEKIQHEDIVRMEIKDEKLSRIKWSSIVYKEGQKELARLFLKEAELALELCERENQ